MLNCSCFLMDSAKRHSPLSLSRQSFVLYIAIYITTNGAWNETAATLSYTTCSSLFSPSCCYLLINIRAYTQVSTILYREEPCTLLYANFFFFLVVIYVRNHKTTERQYNYCLDAFLLLCWRAHWQSIRYYKEVVPVLILYACQEWALQPPRGCCIYHTRDTHDDALLRDNGWWLRRDETRRIKVTSQ